MASTKDEKIFTTFQVAKICNVYHTTVINWVNKGRLKAYITPGGHRRIRLQHLLEFMEKFDFPIPKGLAQRPKRILVVEDDAALQRLLIDNLKELPDVEILSCNDGLSALIEIGKEAPDLLILDIWIPGIDGIGVCRLLKGNEHTQQVQIIAISGKHLSETDRKYIKDNTDWFYRKPFHVEEVVAKAAELISADPTITT